MTSPLHHPGLLPVDPQPPLLNDVPPGESCSVDNRLAAPGPPAMPVLVNELTEDFFVEVGPPNASRVRRRPTARAENYWAIAAERSRKRLLSPRPPRAAPADTRVAVWARGQRRENACITHAP